MYRINISIIFISLFLIFWGCQKKLSEVENRQELIPPEVNEVVSENFLETPSNFTAKSEILVLPPAGPYKPTNKQIQLALKNAGFYKGVIDGVIGPKTIKAIKEFQAKNNLAVDGKVGPKTWAILSRYLNTTDNTFLPHD
ncbi:MAG: peptidoglycan-binding protein [Candidatus Omnitrophica bacterium]|nr:peptidoglycan-binding protein [Candidatus Omnitrophota bacterium]